MGMQYIVWSMKDEVYNFEFLNLNGFDGLTIDFE